MSMKVTSPTCSSNFLPPIQRGSPSLARVIAPQEKAHIANAHPSPLDVRVAFLSRRRSEVPFVNKFFKSCWLRVAAPFSGDTLFLKYRVSGVV